MKTAKSATFTMRIVAALVSAVMLLCFLPALLAGVTASAEGETEEPGILQLEEVDAMETDGYKIEKQSGVYTDPTDSSEHPYDYVMTVSDEIYFVRSGTLAINNVASRQMIFNVLMPDGKPVSGVDFFDHGSWWDFSSTDDVIAELEQDSPNIVYLLTGLTPGETVLTATLDATPSEGNVEDDGGSDYTPGVRLYAQLRILYKCVTVENTPFTFTSAVRDLNNNANGVWLYGVDIPEADAEWTRAERFIGNGQSNFLNNIYFLEGGVDGTPVEPTDENLAGNDFATLHSNTSAGALMFQIEIRDDHMELYKKVRLGNDPSTEEGDPLDFEDGDAFYLKEGLYYLGKDGNGTWGYQEYGFSYFELSRDQYFVYDGETQTWSNDELGVSITFSESTAGVDVGETVTLTPNVTYGSAVDESLRTITWTSSNDEIATVDQSGVVTGVAEGSAVITATTGTGDYASVTVSVVPSTSITSIRLNATTINLNIGGTRQISATVEGGSAADKSVTWSSSDTSVATVDQNGLVTAVAAGNCTITATASDGKTATANVTVRQGAIDEPDEPEDPDGGDTDPETPADTDEGGGCSSSIVSGTLALGGALIAGAVCAVIVLRKKSRE